MRSKSVTGFATALAVAGLASVIAAAPAASAATTAEPVAAMHLVPVKSINMPAGASSASVILEDGQVLQVPVLAAERFEAAHPAVASVARRSKRATQHRAKAANIVYGSCGSSYFYLSANSNHSGAVISTGYTVYGLGSIYFYYWDVYGGNNTYGRGFNKSWEEDFPPSSLKMPFYQALLGKGYYTGSVNTDSYVFGENGACVAGSAGSAVTV